MTSGSFTSVTEIATSAVVERTPSLAVIVTSCLLVLLFFGGWLVPDFLDFLPPVVWFGAKVLVFIHIFVLLRAAIPRPRYDQLMSLGWKILLPLTLVNLLVTGFFVLWEF